MTCLKLSKQIFCRTLRESEQLSPAGRSQSEHRTFKTNTKKSPNNSCFSKAVITQCIPKWTVRWKRWPHAKKPVLIHEPTGKSDQPAQCHILSWRFAERTAEMLTAKHNCWTIPLPVLSRLGVMARKLLSEIQTTYSHPPPESSGDFSDLFHIFHGPIVKTIPRGPSDQVWGPYSSWGNQLPVTVWGCTARTARSLGRVWTHTEVIRESNSPCYLSPCSTHTVFCI